jgi:hypothetical protein
MPGVKALRKLQIGAEDPIGTAVAATAIWRGLGTIEDDREIVMVDEDVGVIAPTDRAYIPRVHALLDMEEIEATFEQIPYIFEAGIKLVTPSADGSGSGYTYTYPFSTTAQNTLRSYTIEGGDDQQAEEMEYGLVQQFTLSGTVGEAMKVSAQWMGRQVANSTYTGALSLVTVEEILFGKTSLFIDASGGTIGDTQVSTTLLDMSLDANTGVIPVFSADGELYYSTHKIRDMEVVLNMTFEHNASAVGQKTIWRGPTKRLIRLETTGDALTTSGTHSTKKLRIDLAGFYSDWSKLGERDGNDIYEVEFTARYISGDSLFCEILVVNELSALP